MSKSNKSQEREFCHIIEPFGHRLKVILTADLKASYRALEVTDDDLHSDATACIVYTTSDDGLTYMLLNFNAGAGTIAHESWHVIYRMLKGLGAKLDNETVAYHLGDLVRKITEFQLDTRKMLKERRAKERK